MPFQNKSLSVAKYEGYKLFDRWPMEFVNTNDDRINVSPENNERLALPLREQPEEFTTDVNLKFDFFKKKFTYKFFGLNNLFD